MGAGTGASPLLRLMEVPGHSHRTPPARRCQWPLNPSVQAVGTTLQACPFQCRASGPEVAGPTAQTSVAEVAAAPDRNARWTFGLGEATWCQTPSAVRCITRVCSAFSVEKPPTDHRPAPRTGRTSNQWDV